MATAIQADNQANAQTSPYNELHELAPMLGADEHPLFSLATGLPVGGEWRESQQLPNEVEYLELVGA